MAAVRKLLFVHRLAPLAGQRPAELLEAALIAAAFDQEVHLVFQDDGVWQLAAQGMGKEAAEELAEMDHVWVEKESLAAQGLTAEDLVIEAKVATRARLAKLVAGMNAVFAA